MNDLFKMIDVLGLSDFDFTEEEIIVWFEYLKSENTAGYFFTDNDIKLIHKHLRKIKIEKLNNRL